MEIYRLMPQFEWDDQKNQTNKDKHGINFQEASQIFRLPVLTRIDDRNDYGEDREISIGSVERGIILVVVHTIRTDKMRIVSARKANQQERTWYDKYLQRKAKSY